MPINQRRIDIALSTFGTFKSEPSRIGAFTRLYGRLHFLSVSRSKLLPAKLVLAAIVDDLWNIETIALRLHLDRDRHANDQISDSYWMQFASCDLMLFHVSLRSLFDYLARFANELSLKPGQIPDSFEALRNFVQNPANRTTRVGEELSALIDSCDWFPGIRKVRDSIVHNAGHTLVFPEKRRILFQVHDHEAFRNQIYIHEVMENENVVDFELYCGLLIGYLYAYLEEFSELAAKILGLGDFANDSYFSHPGTDLLKTWILRVKSVPPATGA